MTEKSSEREKFEPSEQTDGQKIEVFNGIEETRWAIEKIIKAGKDYQHFIGYSNTKSEKSNTEWARENIVPKKVAAGIKSTGIYYPTETIKKVWQPASHTELRDVNLLPENFQLPLRFYVYGDTILFIEEIEDSFRSLEITDPRIAKEMKDIFERFLRGIKEKKEKKVTGREVDLYLIRHGEAESQEKSAKLSSKGGLQAEVAALCLLSDIWSQGGGLLKLFNSPTPRAKETSDIMQTKIQKIIESAKHSPINLYNPRITASLEAAGVIGPLMKMGIPYEKTIEHWLMNPEAVEGKTPQVIYKHLQEFLHRGQRSADRLPPGEKIYYIGITHEVPQAALLHQASGKTLNELGGSIKNCELMKIKFEGKSKEAAIIEFRDKEMKIEDIGSEQNQ